MSRHLTNYAVCIAIMLASAPLAAADDNQADDTPRGVPSYNAEWGEGRGFRPGQTLPDIPLTDMQGREVRFSQFLGKRYIIYCWASW